MPLTTPADAALGVSRTRTFLPSLEAMRGIAVLLVFWFHLDGRIRVVVPGQEPSVWTSFVRGGHTGVDLFFLLSGFLLAFPFLGDRRTGLAEIRVFYTRRALRILPLYWAAVLCGVLMTGQIANLGGALPYLLFLNSLPGMGSPLPPWSDVWWSLATEVQFYLLLPVLGLARRGGGWWGAGVGVLGLWLVSYVGMLRMWYHPGSIAGVVKVGLSVIGRGPLFLWGIAAAWLYLRHGASVRAALSRRAWVRAGAGDLVLAALAVALMFFLDWVQSLPPGRRVGMAGQSWHVVAGGLWAGVLLTVLLAPLRSARVFASAPLQRLGMLSYSLYLLHVPVIHYTLGVVRGVPPSWTLPSGDGPVPIASLFSGWNPATVALAVVILVACIGLSSVTFRWIERPLLARKARFDVEPPAPATDARV